LLDDDPEQDDVRVAVLELRARCEVGGMGQDNGNELVRRPALVELSLPSCTNWRMTVDVIVLVLLPMRK
jgi:hypothetical protein